VGVAIVALVALLLLMQAILPPSVGGPDLAQATLSELASVAALNAAPALSRDQFLYVRTTSTLSRTRTDLTLGTSWTTIVSVRRETWLASDGSGRILERFGQPRFPTSTDRETWAQAGSPKLLPHGRRYDSPFHAGELAPRDLGALPRDPESLAALITSGEIAGISEGAHGNPLSTVADLLGEVPATAGLRSSLFNATALLTGIESLGIAADPLGRSGIAVAVVGSGVRVELIFDSKSSALLAKIVSLVDAEGHPLRVLERTTYVDRVVVDSTDARS
jgi:hypothetical protein